MDSKSAPLIIRGVAYVSGISNGSATVRAYDVNPYRDLDNDGNSDDGLPDLSYGLPYDEIWRYNGGGSGAVQPSTPVFASFSVRGAGGVGTNIYNLIYVTMPNGDLAIFNATPTDGNGRLIANNAPTIVNTEGAGAYDANLTGGAAPAPVFVENRIYQVEPNGLLVCRDAVSGTTLWTTFATAPTDKTIAPAATPTVGYVQQIANTAFAQASGGATNDLMLYMPVRETRMNGSTPALMYPYWLGTRNEVQTWANGADGENGLVNTRIAGGPGGPKKNEFYMAAGMYASNAFIIPKVAVYTADLDPADPTVILKTAKQNLADGIVSKLFDGAVVDENGQIQITKSGAYDAKRSAFPDLLVSVDYDVVYIPSGGGMAPPNYSDVGARNNGRLGFGGSYAGGLNTPAFSPDDILMYVADQSHYNNTGGSGPVRDTEPMAGVFAATEQEGSATTLIRWHMDFFGDGPGTGFTRITNDNYKTAVFPAGLSYVQQALIRDVNQQSVVDLAPLRNYLVFDPAWPGIAGGSQNADKIQANVGGVLSDDYETLANTRVIGSPIVTNDGLTYVLANAFSLANSGLGTIPNNAQPNVSVLMAFKTNPEIVLHTQQPFDDAQGVQVQQADVLSDPANPATVGSSAVRVNGNGAGQNFTLDGDRSTIILTNFSTGNRTFSAAQSFVVRYTPRGTNAPISEIVTPTPSGATQGAAANANPGGFTPLQFYYVLPGAAQSAPSLIGNNLYYTMKKNGRSYLIAVDADPASTDPAVRLGFGDPVPNVVANLTEGGTSAPTEINHVRMAALVSSDPNVVLVAPPVGSENDLIVNSSVTAGTPSGTFAYSSGLTLISSNVGLVEARPDGSAAWKLDTTVERSTVGGKLVSFDRNGQPFDPTASGANSVARIPLAHPTAIRRISDSDFLIADTGSNRAVRVDRAGNVLWNLTTLSDPYGILASGDPLTLSGPTDVQVYTVPTIAGGAVTGYSIHYLVADAGNFRVVEVADFYNANGSPADAPARAGTAGQHVVVWTTRTSAEQSRQLRYQGIQRRIGSDPVSGNFGFPYLVAVVGNTAVASTTSSSTPSADATGGALVSLNYAPFNTPIVLRNNSGAVAGTPTYWSPPAVATDSARTTEPVGSGLVLASRSDLTIENIDNNGVRRQKRIANPTYFQQLILPDGAGGGTRTLYLICDGDGVYAVESTIDNGQPELLVRWKFDQSDYNQMNGVDVNGNINPAGTRLAFDAPGAANNGAINPTLLPELPKFSPSSVRLLASGNFLISNSYAGRSSLFDGGRFVGEVFEVKPFGTPVAAPLGAAHKTEHGGTFDLFAVPALNQITVRSNNGGGALFHVNKQVMGNPTGNTALLEQPVYSDRP